MVIVVTGAEGFLGRRVVSSFSSEGRAVVAVDRVAHTGSAQPGVMYHQADLTDATSLLPACGEASPPFVLIHLAWDMRRHLGYAIQAEQIRQFAGLLDHWTGRGLTRLVAMGSAEEYGNLDGCIKESASVPRSLSPYGWAKHCAHDLANAWSERTQIPVMWLRPFIIYGPGQRGDMMIPYAVECARTGQAAQFTDGQQKRDFVYVDDVVEGIRLAARRESSGMQVCNLGWGEPVLVGDVLKAIAGHFAGSRFALGARARRPGEPDVQVASIQRAQKVLGWQPRINWKEGVRRVCEGGAP